MKNLKTSESTAVLTAPLTNGKLYVLGGMMLVTAIILLVVVVALFIGRPVHTKASSLEQIIHNVFNPTKINYYPSGDSLLPSRVIISVPLDKKAMLTEYKHKYAADDIAFYGRIKNDGKCTLTVFTMKRPQEINKQFFNVY